MPKVKDKLTARQIEEANARAFRETRAWIALLRTTIPSPRMTPPPRLLKRKRPRRNDD
jgi:hypothetical protein